MSGPFMPSLALVQAGCLAKPCAWKQWEIRGTKRKESLTWAPPPKTICATRRASSPFCWAQSTDHGLCLQSTVSLPGPLAGVLGGSVGWWLPRGRRSGQACSSVRTGGEWRTWGGVSGSQSFLGWKDPGQLEPSGDPVLRGISWVNG